MGHFLVQIEHFVQRFNCLINSQEKSSEQKNLHGQAWDVFDALICAMRNGREGVNEKFWRNEIFEINDQYQNGLRTKLEWIAGLQSLIEKNLTIELWHALPVVAQSEILHLISRYSPGDEIISFSGETSAIAEERLRKFREWAIERKIYITGGDLQ